METVTLWTFQSKAIVSSLRARQTHLASWETVSCNWRFMYEWMTVQMYDAIKLEGTAPPVWCWHSCNGKRHAAPLVWTARALLSDYDFEQGMVRIRLEVPVELMQLSSYYAWNRFMDSAMIRQRLPQGRRCTWMFEEPLIRHRTDDIQATIPFIRPEWVRRITQLKMPKHYQSEESIDAA